MLHKILKSTLFWSVIISFAVGAIFALFFHLDLLETWEMVTYDWRFVMRGPEKGRDDIIICTIDDNTLKTLGSTYPIPRDFYVPTLETLGTAKGVGLDILFIEPSPPRASQAAMARESVTLMNGVETTNDFYTLLEQLQEDKTIDPYLFVAQFVKDTNLTVLDEEGNPVADEIEIEKDGKKEKQTVVRTFYRHLRNWIIEQLAEKGLIENTPESRLAEDERLRADIKYLAKQMANDKLRMSLAGYLNFIASQYPECIKWVKNKYISGKIVELKSKLAKTPDNALVEVVRKTQNVYTPMYIPEVFKGSLEYENALKESDPLAQKIFDFLLQKQLLDKWSLQIAAAKEDVINGLGIDEKDITLMVERMIDQKRRERVMYLVNDRIFTSSKKDMDWLWDVKDEKRKKLIKEALGILKAFEDGLVGWISNPDDYKPEIIKDLPMPDGELDENFEKHLSRVAMAELILSELKKKKLLDLWWNNSPGEFSRLINDKEIRKRLEIKEEEFNKLGGEKGLRRERAKAFAGQVKPEGLTIKNLVQYKLANDLFGENMIMGFLPNFMDEDVDNCVLMDFKLYDNFLFSNDYNWEITAISDFTELTVEDARKNAWSALAAESLSKSWAEMPDKKGLFTEYVESQLSKTQTKLDQERILDYELRKRYVEPMGSPYKDEYADLLTSFEMTAPLLPLCETARKMSYVQIDPDDDGTVRAYPLIIRSGESIYPSLALRMTMDYLGVDFKDIEIKLGEYILLPQARYPQNPDNPVDIRIPVDRHGKIKINWKGPWGNELQTFKYVSFIGAYHRDEKGLPGEDTKEISELVKDGLVVMGLTATGTTDFNPMPFQARYPMVGSHVNVINTILDQCFIFPAPKWLEYLLILLLPIIAGVGTSYVGHMRDWLGGVVFGLVYVAISIIAWPFAAHAAGNLQWIIYALLCVVPPVAGYFSYKISRVREPLLVAALIIIYAIIAAYLFTLHQIFWINIIYSAGGMFVSFALVVFYKYMTEERKQRQIRDVFQQYMNKSVIHELLKNPEAIQLGGEDIEATAFFSDVVKFSTLSEGLAPNELVTVLNEYLSEMTDIILNQEALLDKYIGDAIVAAFGVPVYQKDHAVRACYAAIENREQLARLNEHLKPMLEAKNKKPLDCRIGLNSGMMTAGNMGSKIRKSYTIMGDTVNLASRLEGANKFFGTKVMIGENTFELAKDYIEARLLDKIQVVGKNEPVKVYELIARKDKISEQMATVRALYEEALQLNWARKWSEALELLKKTLEVRPEDGPAKELVKICEGYLVSPPPEDWDGRRVFTEKG